MIYWFTKRWRRGALLLGLPMIVLAFVLLNTAGSTQPMEQEEDSARDSDGDLISDAYELFFGLNPTDSADANLDYDGDALTNLVESVKLTDPFCEDTDRDGFFDDMDEKISRAYIQWGDPQFTTDDQYEYAHPDWLLGAYKNGGEWIIIPEESPTNTSAVYKSAWLATRSAWHVSGGESNNVASLNIDLDRTILTNNLRYAIHYEGRVGQLASALALMLRNEEPPGEAGPCPTELTGGTGCPALPSSLFLDLLDTNGVVIIQDLYGNLLTGSNVSRYVCLPGEATSLQGRSGVIPAEAGIQSTNGVQICVVCITNDVLLLEIPTAKIPDAAVIQLRRGDGEIIVYEGLLYIDEDNDGLDADQERQIGTSDYSIDSNNNGTNDYDECFHTGSSTNNPGDGGGGGGGDNGEDDDQDSHKKSKIIYVDQAIGNDAFTGRAPVPTSQRRVGTAGKGPKKTVRGGLAIAETNDTIIIRSGVYNENLNISGKDVKVFIEGNVRL